MENVVKVRIFGKEYFLTTEESESYAQKLAMLLNQKLEKTVKGVPSISKLDAAVLVALDCVDEAYKSSSNIENIRSQIKKYADDASQATVKADELKRENDELKSKIKKLEKELAVRKALTSESDKK